MRNQLVLSCFPGADLLGRAFREEGFCVVKGPDLIFGEDIRGWSPPAGVFDGVIGGPPCQCFSRMKSLNGHAAKNEDLIPEFRRVVEEAEPSWWLMENVPDAYDPAPKGYSVQTFLLNNRWLGETVAASTLGLRHLSPHAGRVPFLPVTGQPRGNVYEVSLDATGANARGFRAFLPGSWRTHLSPSTGSSM